MMPSRHRIFFEGEERTALVVERSSLAAPPASVWERVSSREGINAELMPIVAMMFPRAWSRIDPRDVSAKPRCRSVMLLFGVLPYDLHSFALLSVSPGHGFLERSYSLINAEWIHERTLAPLAGGTELTDRVFFQCRLPAMGAVMLPVVRAIFRHRHRRLRKHFGVLGAPA